MRRRVLRERGLDLREAGKIFAGFHLTRWDEKHSDDENRWVTVGVLDEAVVPRVWTERDGRRRM